LSHVVIACILNQFRGHWLLNVALNVAIFMSLKLKKRNKPSPKLSNALIDNDYHDSNFGHKIKQGHGKVRARVQPRNHIHTPESARECEGMSPHTPKWIAILGVGVPMES
jgi:hypothetical protein